MFTFWHKMYLTISHALEINNLSPSVKKIENTFWLLCFLKLSPSVSQKLWVKFNSDIMFLQFGFAIHPSIHPDAHHL